MRKLGTATKKGELSRVEKLFGLILIAGFRAVLGGAAAGAEEAKAPAAEAGWSGPKAEFSGKVLFDGGDVKVWSYDSRVVAGLSWKPAEKVTVSAVAGGSYKQISMGEKLGERDQVSNLGVAEIGGSLKVRASEHVDAVLQASAGSVVLGSRETRTNAGAEESKAVSGTIAGIQAGIDWKLPGERLALNAGVVYEQARVSYERGSDDEYGKVGFTLGLSCKF